MLYTSSKGVAVESELTLNEAVTALTSHDSFNKANGFAASLYKAANSKRGASLDQIVWIHKLANEVLAPATPVVQEVTNLDNFTKVVELFNDAGQKLKFPKLTFTLDNGVTIRLSKAGARSKYNGQVIVSSPDAGFNKTYYGRIDTDGAFVHSKNTTPEITEFLKVFSANPLEVAMEHGKRTGRCCFCNRPLKDDNSVENGYGPVCAKRWSLV